VDRHIPVGRVRKVETARFREAIKNSLAGTKRSFRGIALPPADQY
jgi:hypothetical protein